MQLCMTHILVNQQTESTLQN